MKSIPTTLSLWLLWQNAFTTNNCFVAARLNEFQDEKDETLIATDNVNERLLHPNGIVTLPTFGGHNPQGEQTHCKRYAQEDDDTGAYYIRFIPCAVDTWFDWQIAWTEDYREHTDQFPYWSPKRYQVSMRVRTDYQRDDVVFELRHTSYDEKHVLFRSNVSIPQADGEWHLTTPIEIPHDIGGNDDLTFRVTFPTSTQGEGGTFFHVRDFDFVPPGAFETGEHSVDWFIEWQDRVVQHVKQQYIPELPLGDLAEFNRTLDAFSALIEEENKAADKKAYREPIHEAYFGDLLNSALPTLEGYVDPVLANIDHTDPKWLQAIILTHATPLKLADYCHDHGQEACHNFVDFMETNTDLMYEFVKYGGAKAGFYGQALDLYNQLKYVMIPGYPILEKLAMAVALELAQPSLHHRWQPEFALNPIERYKHYESAYLGGELDPFFEILSVWELRYVVNDYAADSELTWARQMLRTYRPDHTLEDDHNWRYNRIMQTDVYYRRPVWTSLPEGDPIQTLSTGGFCGPRAQFARFISRAFGIPVWGVVVPGHAAYMKWHDEGWTNPLGHRWWYGWWEDRDGFDFVYEADIRREYGDDVYFREVESFAWIAKMMGEWQKGSLPQKDNPWTGLSLMQRLRVHERFDRLTPSQLAETQMIDTLLTELMEQPLLDYEPMFRDENDAVIIPAMSWTANNGGIEWMKSYGGGMQLLLNEGGEVIFEVNSTSLGLDAGTYRFEIQLSSIHSDDPVPFKLAVSSSATEVAAIHEIPSLYTFGLWEWTRPIEVQLGGGVETLELSRNDGECAAVSIKGLRITSA